MKVRWTFADANGTILADTTGCVTIAALKITTDPVTLTVGLTQD
jgi:hypothetical protein